MTSCASAEANRVDAKLNSTYRALLAKVASQPEAVAKIKAAERAWVAYRDAYIEASYPMPLLSVVPELDATAFAADCAIRGRLAEGKNCSENNKYKPCH